jgi:hypothetical protein
MLPQIKKKMKSFLMDETGSISKANLIKGALFLTATSATVNKVKATTPGENLYPGDWDISQLTAEERARWDRVGILPGDFDKYNLLQVASGSGVGYGCGGQVIPGRCNQLEPVKLPGDPTSIWKCAKAHCTWTCVAEIRHSDDRDNNGCCTKKSHTSMGATKHGHTNQGAFQVKMGKDTGHENRINFVHTPSNKGLKGTHEHTGFAGDWVIYQQCAGTVNPHHNNHCQHGSHTSW